MLNAKENARADEARDGMNCGIKLNRGGEMIHRRILSEDAYDFKQIAKGREGFEAFFASTPTESYRIEVELFEGTTPHQLVIRWKKQTLIHRFLQLLQPC